jgi:hypothetical protein
VQRNVEGEPRILPAEEPGCEGQVRGAADGRELSERLDDGEDDDLVERHGISYRNIEFERPPPNEINSPFRILPCR